MASSTSPLDGLLAGLRLSLSRFLRQVHGAPEPERDPASDDQLLLNVADWNGLAALVSRRRVAGLFLHGIEGRPALGDLPLATIRQVRDQARLRAAQRLLALKEIVDCLAAANVPCLVLKGLPLSQRLYGHPWQRESVDIDVLVSPTAFGTAARTLNAAGWRLPPGTLCRRSVSRSNWDLKHRTLVGTAGRLELHRRLCSNPEFLDTSFDFQRVHACRAEVAIGAVRFPVLSRLDDLLYVVGHGVRHGWTMPTFLCDAAVALGSMARDPQELQDVQARFREARLERALASVVLLCRRAFHLDVPVQPTALSKAGRRRAAWVAGRVATSWVRSGPRGVAERARSKASAMLLKRGFRPAVRELACMAFLRLDDLSHRRPRIGAVVVLMRASNSTKAMAVEAATLLLLARLVVKYVPFGRYKKWMVTGEETVAGGLPDGNPQLPARPPWIRPTEHAVARKVGRAVRDVAERVPFEAVCLPQAMAAQWMLRRRGLSSRLVIGVRRRPGKDLELHAWLLSDGRGVVGHEEAETYAAFPSATDVPRGLGRAEAGRRP